MKNTLIITTALLTSTLFITSCSGGKKGDGDVITEQRNIKPFTKIVIEGTFPVEISQTGEPASVKVETDQNLQELVQVTNEGDKLIVKTREKASIRRYTKLKVFINVKDINELEFNSVGSLTTSNTLKLDSLELNSESIGKLNLEMEADFLRADLNSVGSTVLKGKVREARINNKSVGSLAAYGLKAETLMIHNTAVGTVEVYADSAFYIRSSAIGTLYYKGPGVIKEMNSEGVGQVKRVD